jgi:hypothetical protein
MGTHTDSILYCKGILVLCIAFAKDFAGLMVLRFLEGVAGKLAELLAVFDCSSPSFWQLTTPPECTTYPALLIITASWYTKDEHAMRSVIWGSANAGMDVLTSLINYGIGSRAQNHPGGLAPWKGISVFLGCLTIALSVIVYFLFGTPREVRWLSAQERRMAYARIVNSQTGSDAQKRDIKWDQVRTTFKDPQTYFFFFLVLVNSIPNGGTTAFGNLVYVSFGFSPLDTIVKGKIPQQLISIAWFLVAGYITLKKPGVRCKYCQLHCILTIFVCTDTF